MTSELLYLEKMRNYHESEMLRHAGWVKENQEQCEFYIQKIIEVKQRNSEDLDNE